MILVTGATGMVGAHLVYHLTSKGHKVRATYRNGAKVSLVKNVFSYFTKEPKALLDKIEWVLVDITDVPALEKVFDGVEYVYHCAANLTFNPKDYTEARNVNVIGTANMINLSIENKIKKFCHVSSIATLDEVGDVAITESSGWNPEVNKKNIYAITKYGAELEAWRGTQEGLDVVIVNPGLIIGGGFWNTGSGKLISRVADGFRYYTDGTVGCIDVNDVVLAMIELMNGTTVNERFVLVSENVSYKDLMQNVLGCLGVKSKPKQVSSVQLRLFYYLDSLKARLTFTEKTLYKTNVNTAFKKLNYDASKAKNVLSFGFKTIAESVAETVGYWKKDEAKS